MKFLSSRKVYAVIFMSFCALSGCSEKKSPEEAVAPEQPVSDLPAAPAAPVAPEAPISLEDDGGAGPATKSAKKSAKKKSGKSKQKKSSAK